MSIQDIEQLCRERHAVRDFDPTPVSKEMLERLLKVAQSAPSSYNLQPVQFYVATQQQVKEQLLAPCINQKAILTASAIVAFAVDRDAAEHNFERLCQMDVERGILTEEKRDFYTRAIDMSFSHKLFGMGWVAKALFAPILRFFTPVPALPAIHKSSWTGFHAGMSSMVFILAAQSEGLSTCPIGAFDEGKVKKVLSIPRRFDVPILVAVGHSQERPVAKAKLPFDEIIHWN
jgi:nitroreductase